MIDLKPYAVFAEVVAAGSMSAAARRLGMTPSAVSQIINNLEHRMGITLLHRSTRKLTLTEAGARCYPHSLHLLDAGRAAAASLEQARDAPAGSCGSRHRSASARTSRPRWRRSLPSGRSFACGSSPTTG